MAIEAQTSRTVRDRLDEWQSTQLELWNNLDRMSFVFNSYAEYLDLDLPDDDDQEIN